MYLCVEVRGGDCAHLHTCSTNRIQTQQIRCRIPGSLPLRYSH
uniref:Uncharacterized protein n=1 Tax=Anguilla anguilla TaxID=7936 RepID=A0A0E9UNE6_ANGAN